MALDQAFQLAIVFLALICIGLDASLLKPRERWDSFTFWMFGAGLIAFTALRPLGVGVDDLYGYTNYQFNPVCPTLKCGIFVQGDRDQAWYSLIGLLKSLDPSPRVQLVLVAVALGFKLWIISKLTKQRSLALLVYAALFYIIHDITALRLSLAVGVYLWAFYALTKGFRIRGGLSLIVNGFFHKQAFVALLLFLGQWIPWTRRRSLILMMPMLLLMMGIYPNDYIFQSVMNFSNGPYWANILFGSSYVALKLAGAYDKVRTWPLVAPPTMVLSVWLLWDLLPKSLLFRYSTTNLFIAVLFLWGYAVIPEVQLRFWHFFMVPIVFVVGNAQLTGWKLAAIMILVAIYVIKYTTLHHLLLDQRTLFTSNQLGGSIVFVTEGTFIDDQTRNFVLGSKVEVRAEPNDGYRFEHWTGDCSGFAPACVIDMNQDRRAEAHYKKTAKVTLESSGSGVIQSNQTGESCVSNCAWILDVGTELILTAIPEAGSQFGAWEGACSGSDSSCKVRINHDAPILGRFVSETQFTRELH